jgi:hypothetical protein
MGWPPPALAHPRTPMTHTITLEAAREAPSPSVTTLAVLAGSRISSNSNGR